MSAKEIEAYIARAPRGVQGKLKELRSAIKQVAPGANESISYRMPYYSYKGRLAWFALMKNHIGLYLRPPVIAEHKRELTRIKLRNRPFTSRSIRNYLFLSFRNL